MKRIKTFFQLDMKLARRDSLAVYSLVSPILLAVVLRLLIPTVQDVSVTLAVSDAIEPAVVKSLEEYGEVEVFETEEQVIERVNQNDDVGGIVAEGDGYRIILEGNEGPTAGDGVAVLLVDVIGDVPGVTITSTDLRGDPVPIREYAAAMMAMLGLFIGGIIVGFSIVEEKEGGAIRALAVSPLKISEYITARSLLALIIGCISSVITVVIILGWQVSFGLFALALFVSLFVALPFGFIIGAFADNQMTAFALLKLLMAAFMTLPFVSIFVPSGWQWVFFILPNYWMFQSLSNALVGSGHVGMVLAAPLTVVTGFGLLMLLMPKFKKGLRLR